MPDAYPAPQEMRRQLHEQAFDFKRLGSIDVAAPIVRQCLQLQRHSGLSGEDTYTMIAWHLMNAANVYAKELHQQFVMARPVVLKEWLTPPRPIDTAPKDRAIMLLMPELHGVWARGWWRGCWSHVAGQWGIHLPFAEGNKGMVGTLGPDQPQPTHWTELPPCP